MRIKLGLASALLLAAIPMAAQTAASRIPRMPDGKPNLNGIWQTMNTANWDLLTHGPAMSPVVAMGAQGATPPGIGAVEGNEIPYLPAAAKITGMAGVRRKGRTATCELASGEYRFVATWKP